MYQQEKTVEATIGKTNRAEWKCPQICRMDAGQAEIGASNKTDGLNTAS